MNNHFRQLPEVYRKSVEKIGSYPSKKEIDKYIEDTNRLIDLMEKSKRVIWIGTGRQEEIAEFATRLTKANDKSTFCSKDTSIPYEYNPKDVVVALSSSGETERTIHYAESAYRKESKPTPVVAITTNPNSTLANIAEKTGGFIVNLPGKSKKDQADYQERQFLGEHEPLTLGGTLGELYALEFILDSIGCLVTEEPVMEFHQKLWEKISKYEPKPEEYQKLYEMLPKPINYSERDENMHFPNKIIVGGLEISGVVARAFAIRLAHCAKKSEERRVNYYKDAGNISTMKGDLVIIFSGSGQRFWARALKPIKEVGGKVVGVTSFPNSPLGKVSDLILKIPGRQRSKHRNRLENPPKNPKRALFEIRSILAMEAFIHTLVEKERIPLIAVENKHPDMT